MAIEVKNILIAEMKVFNMTKKNTDGMTEEYGQGIKTTLYSFGPYF